MKKVFNTSAKMAKVLADRNRLWSLFRPAHILLTSVPDVDAPLKTSTPLRMFVSDLIWLFFFTAISALGVFTAGLGWGFLPLSVLMVIIGMLGSVGRLRRLIVGHVHEATHGIVAKFYRKRGESKPAARRKAEVIIDLGTALTFTQNGQSYRREHARHHQIDKLGTRRDPDGRTLDSWGVWPGKTGDLYGTLVKRIFSPAWHVQVFVQRARSNLCEGKTYRRAIGALVLAGLVGSVFILPLPIWLVTVFLPFGPLLHVASLLQVITEHPYGAETPAQDLKAYAALTWERIPWAPMPAPGSKASAWAGWAARMGIHLASRLAVLDDTMIGHSYHHLAWPVGRPFEDWWNTLGHYVRAVEANALPEGVDDRIVEGLIGALERQSAYFKKLHR